MFGALTGAEIVVIAGAAILAALVFVGFQVAMGRTSNPTTSTPTSASLDVVLDAAESAPFPIWHTGPKGTIRWRNRAYQALARQIESDDTLFEVSTCASDNAAPVRVSLSPGKDASPMWFDVVTQPLNSGHIHFASDVKEVVNAENAQRNFVQVLAKTFAHLSTGLAIFDRNRQLVLFNPALIDLTSLPADFLIARPSLFSLFDHLRNTGIMPEPKDYASWRDRVSDVVAQASKDKFSETWHLPSGRTFRVDGHPHPDGAIAFMIEDISAEIQLERQFRADLKISHSALDRLCDCIAIFGAGGKLEHCNDTMRAFLHLPDDTPYDRLSVQDVTRICQSKCSPTPIWGDVRDFVTGFGERETWSAEFVTLNKQIYELQIAPLAAGSTMMALKSRNKQSNQRALQHQSGAHKKPARTQAA